jgi:hypothetical protein
MHGKIDIVDADRMSDEAGSGMPGEAEDKRSTIQAILRCLEYLRESAEEHRQVNLAYLIELAAMEARRVGGDAAGATRPAPGIRSARR